MDTFVRDHFEGLEIIFQAGDAGHSAYVIEEGCVEVLKGEGDHQRRVTVLAQGAMFGEVALLDRQPRTATVRALTPTRLIRIDRGHVEELLVRSDPVIQYLLRLLLVRFRNPNGMAVDMDLSGGRLSDQAKPDTVEGDLHTSAVRTLLLAQDLSNAIAGNQLELFYQPLIALEDMSPVGFEALIRWRHPSLGMVNPMEFIPLAEKTGLIHRIGEWVLRSALKDWVALRAFCQSGNGSVPFISINLSAPELGTQATVDAILHTIANQQIAARELRIELTETSIISNVDAVSAALMRLRAAGVGIALDDFGTGYAGLDYLQTLPFSCIKIDKAFVQQMRSSERSFHIVQSALALAQSLGLSTVAEGIEDAEMGVQLGAMGCTYAQGYQYGHPMPKHEIESWLKTYQLALAPAT